VTAARTDTTVPGQALFLMNNPLIREQALRLANVVLADAQDDATRIRAAHLRALGRLPTTAEAADALAFLKAYRDKVGPRNEVQAWQSYCQILFCSNEFLYVD
jgi:hypothetical protein